LQIAIFSESYAPIVNGVSVSIAILRREMERRGHQVVVFAPHYPGHVDSDGAVFRFPSKVPSAAPDYPLPIPFAPALKKKFLALGVDIVHTQTPFLLGLVGVKWAREAGIPVVSTNHTLYPHYAHYMPVVPQSITRAFLVWHMKRYYSRCDAIVTPSKPVRQILRSYGIDKPIEVIQTGVDPIPPRRSRDEVRRAYGIPPCAPLLLYVGRVAKEKNLDLLFCAFEQVRTRFPETRLMVVGGGPILDALRNRAPAGATFTGMLPREDIWDVYRAADIFTFPSTTETQGLAICEALSAGLPCVVVNEGGAPEVLNNGVDGCLVPDDADAFARAVLDLLSDDNKRRWMSAKAVELSHRFSAEHMAERFERFYTWCIERG